MSNGNAGSGTIVGGRYWGPGRFNEALREAVLRGSAKRLPGGEFAPADTAKSSGGVTSGS